MKDLQFLFYTLPAIVVSFLSYFSFKIYFSSEDKRRQMRLMQELKKEKISIRLISYERMTLFLERIEFSRLFERVSVKEMSKEVYSKALIMTIEKEFDYNLSQQIYMTGDCWKVVETAKKATINIIRKVASEPSIKGIKDFKAKLIELSSEDPLPQKIALNTLKKEVRGLW